MAVTLGVANVGADYDFDRSTGHHVTNCAADVSTIGADCIKLFLSPSYTTNYPIEGSKYAWTTPAATTLSELVDFDEFAGILSDDQPSFTDHFLNCWPFTGFGVGDAWKGETNAAWYGLVNAEYTEYYNLSVKLLTDYNGSNKNFYLQTWEGDHALNEGDKTAEVPPRRSEYMAAWLRARQQAVENARRDTSHTGVTVKNVVEVNLADDAVDNFHQGRMVRKVLPRIKPDVVSYSCYDSLTPSADPWRADQAAMLTDITTRMTRSLDLIASAAPHSQLVIGEFGLPDNEIPVGYDGGVIMQHALDIFTARGDITHAIVWNMWDNEDPRGYGCIDKTDNLTQQGTWLNELLGGGFG